jgi:ubiquinone/menaquinone biosynthesis C-methylase UbiE
MTGASNPFDSIAADYDTLWSSTGSGHWQRQAVWDELQALFGPGDRVLDIGCGTGVDAAFLLASGVDVVAIDASAEMVRIARSKRVAAKHLSAEQLDRLEGSYDGATSNFGVLNCVGDLRAVGTQLARLVRRGGCVSLCFMGRFCAWETAHFLFSGEIRKAIRRWTSQTVSTRLRIDIRYPSVREVMKAFSPDFRLRGWKGVGICVPPSYIAIPKQRGGACLAGIDRRIARVPILKGLSDHRLVILERV